MRTLRRLITIIALFNTTFMLLILGVQWYGQGLSRHVLAYVKYGQGIGFTDADRGISTLLTSESVDLSAAQQLQWSPNGQQLAFTSSSKMDGNNIEIYTITLSDLRIVNLSQSPTNDFDPTWSPDGRKLAYTLMPVDAVPKYNKYPVLPSEIRVIDVPGRKTLDYLTQSAGINFSPVWSPDGQMLAFGSSDYRQTNLEVVDVKSGKRIPELTQPVFGEYPQFWRWSPDSRRLVFASYCSSCERDAGHFKLSVIDLSNRQVRNLFSPIDWTTSPPVWSPDSQFIAFSIYEVSNTVPTSAVALHVMNIVSDRDIVFAVQNGSYFAGSWSSDGHWFGFLDAGNHIIYGANSCDNKVDVLVPSNYQPFQMQWSPDGQLLSFLGGISSSTGLFVLDLNTRSITHLMNDVTFPSWQP